MQQQKSDNKRLFIAAAISMAVLLIWQLVFVDPPEKPASDSDDDQETTEAAEPPGDAAPATPAADGTTPGAVAAPVQVAPAETELVTEHFRLKLTNIGARAFSFEQLDPERYQGVDFLATLVGDDVDPLDPPSKLPLATELDAIGLDADSRFEIVETRDADGAPSILFRWTSPDGQYVVDKRLSEGETGRGVRVDLTIDNRSQAPIDDTLALELYDRMGDSGSFFIPGGEVYALCLTDDDVERMDPDDEVERFSTDVVWAGVDQTYFAMLARSETGLETCAVGGDGDSILHTRLESDFEVDPGQRKTVTWDVYMGPKEKAFLGAYGHELERTIDYGWFEIIAKPLAWLMRWLYGLVNNWGIAIILLTILIRGALWPITQRSQESMMRMRDIQPVLNEIREKYKNDPMLLNQKQMEVFRQYKVSPFGCLPLFLQLPIWIALYRTIFVTAELYRADFGGWVHDLSAPDPFYILPILAGTLFFLQQKLSPTTAQNTQQKIIMTVLPVMFSVAMLFFPAALNLYILCSSLIGMAQVVYTRRKMAAAGPLVPGTDAAGDEDDRDPETAAERRAQQRREERKKRKGS